MVIILHKHVNLYVYLHADVIRLSVFFEFRRKHPWYFNLFSCTFQREIYWQKKLILYCLPCSLKNVTVDNKWNKDRVDLRCFQVIFFIMVRFKKGLRRGENLVVWVAPTCPMLQAYLHYLSGTMIKFLPLYILGVSHRILWKNQNAGYR